MQGTCFDFSHGRHTVALVRMADAKGDMVSLPRFQRECLHDDLVGPYPFAKGPLVAYSHSVAEVVVGMKALERDEKYALTGRKATPLINVCSTGV